MRFGQKNYSRFQTPDILTKFPMSMLADLYIGLKEVSDKKGIPVKMLIEAAVFKALHEPKGFEFEDDLHDSDYPYVEHEHIDKSHKVMDFLRKYEAWNFNFHQILYSYRTIGLKNHIEVLLGLRELSRGYMIKITKSSVSKFKKSENYLIVKIVKPNEAIAERREAFTNIKRLSTPKGLVEDESFKDTVDTSSED